MGGIFIKNHPKKARQGFEFRHLTVESLLHITFVLDDSQLVCKVACAFNLDHKAEKLLYCG